MNFDIDTLKAGFIQVAKNASEIAKDVLTAGGYSALQRRISEHDEVLRGHGNSVQQYENANVIFKRAVEELGKEASDCILLLKDAKELVERLSYSSCSSNIPSLPQFRTPDISNVTATLADFDAAITAGKGAGLGIAASTGAWILVAHLGAASTGTAISGLTGIAAHNAILAWFGGGAIAAGGGGIALGSIAIGALALVPAIGYSAYKSYKEARRIKAEAAQVAESATCNLNNAKSILALEKSAEDVRAEIGEKRRCFAEELAGFMSKAHDLAETTAESADSFAASLVLIAKANGASA